MAENESSNFETVASPAVTIALGAAAGDAGVAEEARHYLRKQVELANYQIEDLRKEDKVRHWSLRVHHVSDLMKLAFELAVAFIVLAIAFGIGAAMWSAAHDESLVIEAFSVPPDMASRGLTGQAVAGQFQDKLVAMQNATKSARPADSYASNWGSDIKVEIPNTGISISELYRYLASWLGHETHITGDVFRTANGLTVIARAGGEGAATAAGAEIDLDKLLQQVAEKIYLSTQPYRYAIFIESLGPSRFSESRRILEGLATSGSMRERAWAWNGIAFLDAFESNTEQAIHDYREVLALSPNFALAYINLDFNEGLLGHDEASLVAAQNSVRLLAGGGDVEMSSVARTISLPTEQANVAFDLNDFAAARTYSEQAVLLPDFGGDVEGGRNGIVISDALLHDAAATQSTFANLPPSTDLATLAQRTGTLFQTDYWLGHWARVIGAREKVEALLTKSLATQGVNQHAIAQSIAVTIWPYVAAAMAETGDVVGARVLIEKTPLDCYTCMRNRARIAQIAHDWSGADLWYRRATDAAPSIPIGYSEWGRMLLEKGDTDGAIAKFLIAHDKGPHFADPLELWGEALMLKNRSDLALVKFEEANKYAPRWGRLHLKWGEALSYLGRKDEARAQFQQANGMDLSASDRASLARH